jgi:3'-5' exoribonuclease
MKQQFVETLQEGDQVNDYFLAAHKDLRTQANGTKFLGMVFRDRTGEVGGIVWNNAQSIARLFEIGDVVTVKGSVSTYRNQLQVRVEQVLPLRDGEYDPEDLVHVPEGAGDALDKLKALLGSVQNPCLRQLFDGILADDGLMARLTAAPAGKKWHHAFPGGLIQHIYEMAQLAETAATVFPRLDRDVLLAGVFLHDIGKVYEMTQDMVVSYTTEGRLLGHLAIGMRIVDERIAQIEGFPESLRLQVLHCILSHHGSLENGSPVLPKTAEAMALAYIDNLGAQTDATFRLMDETRAKGEAWSEYLPQIDRQIWTKED